jgi:hypothetical protein
MKENGDQKEISHSSQIDQKISSARTSFRKSG